MICLLTHFTTNGYTRERGHMAWTSASAAFQFGRLVYGKQCGVELSVCESRLCPVQEAIDLGMIQEAEGVAHEQTNVDRPPAETV